MPAAGDVADLAVAKSGTDLLLSWEADCGFGDNYGVYRGDLAQGYGSIAFELCSIVEGVVMQINAEVHDVLRRKEGFPWRYRETEVLVQIPRNGEIISAMTYVVSDEHRLSRNMPVSPTYRDAILRGASTFRFSRQYQAKLRSLLLCA